MSASMVVWSVAAAVLLVAVLRTVVAWLRASGRPDDDKLTCAIRVVGREDGARPWSRPRRAAWIHDVLVIRPNARWGRTSFLPVATVHGHVGSTVVIRGEAWVALRFELDDGSVVDVATPVLEADALAGPFLVASPSLRWVRD